MAHIDIRRCCRTDEGDILNICYRTGYMGEDLSVVDTFNDIRLFGYLFCLYYPRYEPGNSFVAVDRDSGGKVIGYILGTLNSKKQEKLFTLRMVRRIAIRLLFYTSRKYPESFNAVIFFLKDSFIKRRPDNFYKEYPAHLHINILPEYQHCGIGSRLLNTFEEHVKKSNVPGIHLRTSNKNYKAIPFYRSKGYELIYESEMRLWQGVDNYKSLIFVKKIK